MTSADRVRLERMVERALFGPLDLTIHVAQGLPAAVDRARQQLLAARVIGKFAVDHGVNELRRRLDGQGHPDVTATATDADADIAGRRKPAEASSSVGEGANADGAELAGSSIPDASGLALPDYEQLPAAHIVAKLAGLQQDERDAIEAFEANHRHRRTILGKLDQLRSS